MHQPTSLPRAWWFLSLLGLLVVAGCGGDDVPRTTSEISEEIQSLDALYRTSSGQDVIAPGNVGDGGQVFVDPESGELAWRVWECHNPECPGRNGAEPNLFISANSNYSANPDGTINYGAVNAEGGEPAGLVLPLSATAPSLYCPDCGQNRNFESESDEQRQQYAEYIQPHVLPETAERKAELEAEIVEYQQYVQRRLEGGGQ